MAKGNEEKKENKEIKNRTKSMHGVVMSQHLAGTKRGQGGKGDWEMIKSSIVKGKGTWVSCAAFGFPQCTMRSPCVSAIFLWNKPVSQAPQKNP